MIIIVIKQNMDSEIDVKEVIDEFKTLVPTKKRLKPQILNTINKYVCVYILGNKQRC